MNGSAPGSAPTDLLPSWPGARGTPAAASGVIRGSPADFVVEEIARHRPEGAGQHAWLRVRKTGLDTAEVARRLAQAAGVRPRAVGFAGLKDRHAVATQWFTVDLAGRPEPRWSGLEEGGHVEILEVTRGRRKLRRGALLGNAFRIVVRDVDGGPEPIASRLADLARRGVPDYFGPQRFGRGGANLAAARALLVEGRPLRDRHRRGLVLSAARALLFNEVLARRIADGTWDRLLPGEAVSLDGSRSVFRAPVVDAELAGRAAALDLHPSGPLWGRGERMAQGEARAVEDAALRAHADLRAGLEAAGVEAARRALRVAVRAVAVHAAGPGAVEVAFTLPAGAYATAVLGEVFAELRDAAGREAGG